MLNSGAVQSARDLLASVYRREQDPGRDLDLIQSFWADAVGRRIAMHSRPVFYARRRATIEVDSSEWLQQLEALAPRLRAKLNQAIGENLVDFLLFRTAGVAGAKRFAPGRAVESAPAQGRGQDSQEVRNPMRRRAFLASKAAAGE